MTIKDQVFDISISSNGGKYGAEITQKGRFVKRRSSFSSAQEAEKWAKKYAADTATKIMTKSFEKDLQKQLDAIAKKFK